MLQAGAAALSLEPPLGLPMVGFVRRYEHAQGYGSPLEATALVLDTESSRVALVGVDTMGIPRPEANQLCIRVAEAIGADPTGVILNWNHTHCAPPGSRTLAIRGLGGTPSEATTSQIANYIDFLHEKVVSVARLAAKRLEPAAIAWGVGRADIAVNRRERAPDGRIIIGWRPDGLVDTSVTVLQARRQDGSVIATAVNYGCHPITVGPDVLDYSADYPGPMRRAIRDWAGGHVVFLQGAGGNVIPRVAFAGHNDAEDFGRRLALEALHSVADRTSGKTTWTHSRDGSATPYSLYRPVTELGETKLEAKSAEVLFPLQPLPTMAEISALRESFETKYDDARSAGTGLGQLNVHLFHLNWALQTEAAIRDHTAKPQVTGPIHAIRIGDGAIVSGPGEIFTEIGLAVKERSPAIPTMYTGYTNDAISYFPTAASYAEGGYEPEFGNQSYGLPAAVAPDCERILVERAVELLNSLFPEREQYSGNGWTASGSLPSLPIEPAPEPPRWQ